MAKSFIYDNIDFLNATVEDGTISGTNFSASEVLTNEENINDQNITSTVTSIGSGDSFRFALPSADDATCCALYYTGGNTTTFQLYGSNSATSSLVDLGNISGNVGASGSGWKATSFSNGTNYSYYFLDALFAHSNLAECVLGKKLDFEVEPDIGKAEGREYKVDIAESYSGLQYATQRTSGIRTWQFTWGNISSTFMTNLENMRNDLDGPFKKFIYSEDGTTGPFYWVRMSEDSLMKTEVAHNRFSTSIKLIEQKN